MENILELFYNILASDLDIAEQNQILNNLLNNENISKPKSLIQLCILKIVETYDLKNILNSILPEQIESEILMRKVIYINQCIHLHNFQMHLYKKSLLNLNNKEKNISNQILKKKISNNYIKVWYDNYLKIKEEISTMPFTNIKNLFENIIEKIEKIEF